MLKIRASTLIESLFAFSIYLVIINVFIFSYININRQLIRYQKETIKLEKIRITKEKQVYICEDLNENLSQVLP